MPVKRIGASSTVMPGSTSAVAERGARLTRRVAPGPGGTGRFSLLDARERLPGAPMSLAAFRLPPERVSLLDVDPTLGELLAPERRAAARALRVDVRHVARGELEMRRVETASPSHLGLLIVDGIVTREVILGETVSAELLGAGDLIRPWSLTGGGELLDTRVRWSVVSEHLRSALLDRRFAAELVGYPEVAVGLVDRLNARASRLAVTQAISQLQRVDNRLMALFTHLAERWGRMTHE